MLKNYIKTAWRHITKNKVTSTIHILGLSLGITSCLIIFLIARHEFDFDTFHSGKERIYRLVAETEYMGKVRRGAQMLDPMGEPLRQEITGTETIAVFYNYDVPVIVPENESGKSFDAPGSGGEAKEIIVTDPFYFGIFPYEWLSGSPSVLNTPYALVLTESKAHKYFGDIPYSEMLGKEVVYNKDLHVLVAGVVKDWDKNTDFTFTDFISTASIPGSILKDRIDMESWGMWSDQTQVYFKLAEGVIPAAIESQFPSWVSKYVFTPPDLDIKTKLLLQPLSDIHFNTELGGDVYVRPVHLPALYGLMAIAVFILLIAVFNFINLSTAQSIPRAKEIGVRKALGGSRSKLVAQFMGETLFVTLFAVLLALLITKPLLVAFHSFIPQGLSIGFEKPLTWGFLLLLIMITTLFAGFYPANVLSASSPVETTKGYASKGNSKNILRKTLIVFQFTISLIFIVCTLIVGNQIHYMMNKDMGFDKDAVITVKMKGNHEVLAEKIRQFPYVQMVSLHTEPPTARGHAGTLFRYDKNGENLEISGSLEFCDEHFIPLYGLRLIAGRNVLPSPYMNEFVLNESFVKQLGFDRSEDAVGQYIKSSIWDYMPENEHVPFDQRQAQIVGVVADFHLTSLHDPIRPVAISATTQSARIMSIKLATAGKGTGDMGHILSDIEKTWKEVNPNESLEFAFYDDTIASFYEKEQKTAQIISAAMMMAIFISCMGLFGLAIFTTKQRTKEIGIRKVLGASVGNILVILSSGFLRLVGIAALIASPIAWYAMSRWLEGFAYHTPIRWWIFVLAGLLAALIALITIGMQTIGAARANPVNSLKLE